MESVAAQPTETLESDPWSAWQINGTESQIINVSVVWQNVLQPQHLEQHHLGDHQMHQIAGPGMDHGVGPGAPHVPNGGAGMKVSCKGWWGRTVGGCGTCVGAS